MNSLSFYSGKTVLITGHTGFKGAWLTAWLQRLGAKVAGIALPAESNPSHFKAAGLANGLTDIRMDIRNCLAVADTISSIQPDVVFHLAAQALVRRSYENPVETWQTTVPGTLHVLEALRKIDKPCAAVIITSDKCYDNVEWVWGYRETDSLGGQIHTVLQKGLLNSLSVHISNRTFPGRPARCELHQHVRVTSLGGIGPMTESCRTV